MLTIDAGNTIAVSTSTERVSKSGVERFTNEKQLAALVAHWPCGRLVEIWNKLPGVRKIAKLRTLTAENPSVGWYEKG
jgi:hypothetical protein